ncbi:unnamed protein product [Arctogadus glacialis]
MREYKKNTYPQHRSIFPRLECNKSIFRLHRKKNRIRLHTEQKGKKKLQNTGDVEPPPPPPSQTAPTDLRATNSQLREGQLDTTCSVTSAPAVHRHIKQPSSFKLRLLLHSSRGG